jgi:hypothetical protein
MNQHAARTALLLLPLLGACASSASYETTVPAPEDAFVQVERVDDQTLQVTAKRSGYAYLLEVASSRERPARLVNGGEPVALAPGGQRLSTLDDGRGDTPTANARVTEADRRYCGPGARLEGARGPGTRARSLTNPVPRSAYCVRQDPSAGYFAVRQRTDLLLIATAEPIAPETLRNAVSIANARRASSSASSQGVSARVVDALHKAGVPAYAVRVP